MIFEHYLSYEPKLRARNGSQSCQLLARRSSLRFLPPKGGASSDDFACTVTNCFGYCFKCCFRGCGLCRNRAVVLLDRSNDLFRMFAQFIETADRLKIEPIMVALVEELAEPQRHLRRDPRRAWTISLIVCGLTPKARARAFCEMPRGVRYSSRRISPGVIGSGAVGMVFGSISFKHIVYRDAI